MNNEKEKYPEKVEWRTYYNPNVWTKEKIKGIYNPWEMTRVGYKNGRAYALDGTCVYLDTVEWRELGNN